MHTCRRYIAQNCLFSETVQNWTTLNLCSQTRFYMLTYNNVIKKWNIPGLEKHGLDHAMMTAWWPCFLLAWSSWSWHHYHVFYESYHDYHVLHVLFSKKNKVDCLSMFSEIVATKYHYMAHLTGSGVIDASKVSSQQTIRRLLQKDLEFFSVITKQEILIKQQFHYNRHITAFC